MATQDKRESVAQDDPWAPIRRAWKYFGPFLGGISAINLFNDLDMVQIESQFWGWLNVYKERVEWLGDLLFGWIDFELFGFLRFSVDNTEYHVAVLLLLLVIRAAVASVVASSSSSRVVGKLYLGGHEAILQVTYMIGALLLPSPFGVAALLTLISINITLVGVDIPFIRRNRNRMLTGVAPELLGVFDRRLVAFRLSLLLTLLVVAAIVITDRILTQLF